MTKPKSISDVKDTQDLHALYAERDIDADGKLGPGEASPEEIHEGDVVLGGNGDGYLSPWEVMQMRRNSRIDDKIIAKTLYANEYLGRAFDRYGYWNGRANAERWYSTDELKFKGVRFTAQVSKRSTPHVFFYNNPGYYRNGNVSDGRPAEDIPNPYNKARPFRRGEMVSFTPDGRLIYGSMKCFKALLPDIELLGTRNPGYIERTILGLSKLTPQMLSNVKRVRVSFKRETPKKIVHRYGNSSAYAFGNTGEIGFWKEVYKSPLDLKDDTIQHEAAHLHTHALRKTPFKREWRAVAGHVYGSEYSERISDKTKERRWITGPYHHGPRYGCTSPYGSWNSNEDISEHVGYAMSRPAQYRELIDPTSDYYIQHPDQRAYVAVFRNKLDLLRKYNFISEEIYAEITAPIMEYENDASLEAIAEAILKYDSPSAYRHSEKVLRKACMKASDPAVADRLFRSLLKLGAFEEAEQVMTYLLWEENVDKRETLTDTVTDFLFDYSGKQPIPESLTTAMLKLLNA